MLGCGCQILDVVIGVQENSETILMRSNWWEADDCGLIEGMLTKMKLKALKGILLQETLMLSGILRLSSPDSVIETTSYFRYNDFPGEKIMEGIKPYIQTGKALPVPN